MYYGYKQPKTGYYEVMTDGFVGGNFLSGNATGTFTNNGASCGSEPASFAAAIGRERLRCGAQC